MPSLGGGELLILLVVLLVIFGGTKVPKLARSLGQAQNEFRRGQLESHVEDERRESTPPSS